MDKMNWGRIVLGGLVAGVIINASEYVTNGVILAQRWSDAMKGIGKPEAVSGAQMSEYIILGFIFGIAALWMYAAIRPRYGAGPKTAVCAGLAVWALGYLLGSANAMISHVLPRRLMAISILVGLAEMVVGTLAGAYFYREDQAAAPLRTTVAGSGH